MFGACGDSYREAVDDQCGAVVDQRLGAQQCDVALGQQPGHDADCGGVRRCHGGAQDPGRAPRQAEGVGERGHGPGGDDDQKGAGQG